MKVLGIVGSMRKKRSTETLVQRVISAMASIDATVTYDVVYTPDLDCQPCRVVCHEINCSTHLSSFDIE